MSDEKVLASVDRELRKFFSGAREPHTEIALLAKLTLHALVCALRSNLSHVTNASCDVLKRSLAIVYVHRFASLPVRV